MGKHRRLFRDSFLKQVVDDVVGQAYSSDIVEKAAVKYILSLFGEHPCGNFRAKDTHPPGMV